MITYFPKIYPDELIYSWFARFYVHSGFFNHSDALKELRYSRSNNPNKEFLGHLNDNAMGFLKSNYDVKELIFNHTMFPQYGRFLEEKARDRALNILVSSHSDIHKLFTVLPRNNADKYLKYCPLCVREDRKALGETYWHRQHQIRGITACIKHNCLLIHSDIPAKSEQCFTLDCAEKHTRNMDIFEPDKKILKYNRYLLDVFNSSQYNGNVSTVFNDALKGTKYMSTVGNIHKLQDLADDLKEFYTSLNAENYPTYAQLQRVFPNRQTEFLTICQIAYFLNIPIDRLLYKTG